MCFKTSMGLRNQRQVCCSSLMRWSTAIAVLLVLLLAESGCHPRQQAPNKESSPGVPVSGRATESPLNPLPDYLTKWSLLPVLFPTDEALFFSAYDSNHTPQSRGRVIYLDGRPVGIDLVGLSPTEAAELLAAEPGAVSSVVIDDALLCEKGIIEAVRNVRPGALALSILLADAPTKRLKNCIEALQVNELHLTLENATDEVLEDLGGIEAIEGVQVSGSRVTHRGMKSLSRLPNLRDLGISGIPLDDSDVEQIVQHKRLQRLHFDGSKVTRAGIERLGQLEELLELSVFSLDLGDGSCLRTLNSLKRLRVLDFSMARGEADALSRLPDMPALEELDLSRLKGPLRKLDKIPYSRFTKLRNLKVIGTLFDDDDMAQVARLPALETLFVDTTRVSDVGVQHLVGNTTLVDFSCMATEVTDEGLKSVGQLKTLQVLGLGETKRITDAGLAWLSGLSNIRSLYLPGLAITDKGLAHLRGMKELRRLVLADTPVDGSGFAFLKEVQHLKILNLSDTRLSNSGLAAVAGNKKLQVLHLRNTLVTDEGLVALSGLKDLEKLDLGGTDIGDEGLTAIQGLGLNILVLTGTRVGDDSMASVAKCSELLRLDLDGTAVTDAGLGMLTGNTNLRELLIGARQVTDAGIRDILKLPLRELSIAGTSASDSIVEALLHTPYLKRLDVRRTQLSSDALKLLRGKGRLHITADSYSLVAARSQPPVSSIRKTVNATFAESLKLVAVDVPSRPPQPGDLVTLTWHWRVLGPLKAADLTVFVLMKGLVYNPWGGPLYRPWQQIFEYTLDSTGVPASRWKPGRDIDFVQEFLFPEGRTAEDVKLLASLFDHEATGRGEESEIIPLSNAPHELTRSDESVLVWELNPSR